MSQPLSKRRKHNNCYVHVQCVGRESLTVSHLKININYTTLNVSIYSKNKILSKPESSPIWIFCTVPTLSGLASFYCTLRMKQLHVFWYESQNIIREFFNL